MRRRANGIRWLAAGAVLAAAVAWAGTRMGAPPAGPGVDPGALRRLAERVRESDPAEWKAWQAPARPVAKPGPAEEAPPAPTAAPAPLRARTDAPPALPEAPTPTQEPQRRRNPVENLALVGLTRSHDVEQAWLVDTTSNAREMVEEGDSAFGMRISEIEDDRVVLTSGGDSYELRLGERRLAVAAAPPAPSGFDGAGDGDNPRGFGGRQGGGFGPQQPNGFRGRQGAFGGRQADGRQAGSFAGRGADPPVVLSDGGASQPGFGGRGSFGNGGRGGFGQSGGFGGSGGGAFAGGGFGGGGFAGGGGARGGISEAPQASSNPQTARRRGGRLVEGADPLPAQEPISNPQTARRTGRSQGPAFGEAPGSVAERSELAPTR